MLQPTLTSFNISSYPLERNKKNKKLISPIHPILQNYSVSPQNFKGTPATGFWAGVFSKKATQKILAWVNDNKAMTDTISMCIVGMTIKPIWILSKKKTKKDDKQFLATKSIVGSLVDYGIGMAFITPISVAVKKFAKNISKLQKNNQLPEKLKYLNNKGCMDNFKEITGNIPKYCTAGLKAAIQIPLILTAMKIIFPDNKTAKKKAAKVKAKKQKTKEIQK